MLPNDYFFGSELLIGLLVSVACIAVHSVLMAAVNWSARNTARIAEPMNAHVRLVVVMAAAVSVLMAAHVIEVGMWALACAALSAVPKRADAFYFAFVNYTTLGYGDIPPEPRWRLLGPVIAMNGILMFGWSTAVIYDVLRNVALVAPATAPPPATA